MTKQEFDALFERCKANCLPSDQGQIQQKLARFTDQNGQVSAQALAVFLAIPFNLLIYTAGPRLVCLDRPSSSGPNTSPGARSCSPPPTWPPCWASCSMRSGSLCRR